MKYSKELSKLIIDNIEQHERAAQVLEEIDKTVVKAIEIEAKTIIEKSAPTLDGNEDFDLYENETLNFSFLDWKIEDSNETVFKINIEYTSEDDDTSETWLGYICGIPNQGTGLSLRFSADYRTLGLKAHRYKQLIRESLEESKKLIENGFKLSDSGYELEKPFQFNKSDILAHYPKNLFEAMTPLTNTLEAFIECKSEFDMIVDKIKKQ